MDKVYTGTSKRIFFWAKLLLLDKRRKSKAYMDKVELEHSNIRVDSLCWMSISHSLRFRGSINHLLQQDFFPLLVTTAAEVKLPPTHPIRLALALNFSVFYYEIMNSLTRKGFRDCLVTNSVVHMSTCVQMSISLKFLLWSSLALLLLQTGFGEKCDSRSSEPTVRQTQVKLGEGKKFRVEVMNKCPMCPIINLRLKCQGFPQSLVDPTLLRVLSSSAGNCVVNDGLPLSPMETLSFNYSSSYQFALSPLSWSFQCE
ncbi:unnamed protein product [Brassica oleracea var. botrytis]